MSYVVGLMIWLPAASSAITKTRDVVAAAGVFGAEGGRDGGFPPAPAALLRCRCRNPATRGRDAGLEASLRLGARAARDRESLHWEPGSGCRFQSISR